MMEAETLNLFQDQELGASDSEAKIVTLSVERNKLLKSLVHFQMLVEKKTTAPILSHVLVVAKDNYLELSATDMDLAISDIVEAQVEEPMSFTAPAHNFFEIVRKLPEDAIIEISQDMRSPYLIRMKSGNVDFVFASYDVQQFPVFDTSNTGTEFSLACETLAKAIAKTKFAMSSDESRYNLTCLFMHSAEIDGVKSLISVATDTHRLNRYIIPNVQIPAEQEIEALLPQKTVFQLLKMLESNEGEVKVTANKNKISFKFTNSILISKLVDTSFPNYKNVIPANNDLVMQCVVSDLARAVDRIATILPDKHKVVRFNIANDRLNIHGLGEANGFGDEVLSVSFSHNEEFISGVNTRYILDVLSAIESEVVEVQFSRQSLPLIIKDLSDDNALFIIMPVNV